MATNIAASYDVVFGELVWLKKWMRDLELLRRTAAASGVRTEKERKSYISFGNETYRDYYTGFPEDFSYSVFFPSEGNLSDGFIWKIKITRVGKEPETEEEKQIVEETMKIAQSLLPEQFEAYFSTAKEDIAKVFTPQLLQRMQSLLGGGS